MPTIKTEPKPSRAKTVSAPLEGMPPIDTGRLSLLPPYLATRINALNDSLRAKGVDVIDLGMGNPVDPVADNVIQALKDSLGNVNNHRYGPIVGLKPLREAFARQYARHFKTTLSPDKEVIASIGSKDAFSHLCLAILDSRDAVVVPTPAYPPHLYAPQIAGAHVISVPMVEENPGRKLLDDLTRVFETVRPRPKLLILNFPHNPTAKTVDAPFYEEIIALARRLKFWVLNDMAYGHSCFDNYKAPSIVEVSGAKDVAVEMFTMSKPYSMAGWRVGFLVGNSDLIAALAKIKPYFDYGHFSAIHHAAVVALDTGDKFMQAQALVYQKRRDVLLSSLEKNGWGHTIKNRGTMFSWQAVPEKVRGQGSIAFCEKLAEKTGVSFFPGAGFGEDGEGFVRIALVEPEARIEEACQRIGKFLKQ